MPAYAGFTSLSDYIAQRLARDGLSRTRLSEMIGQHRNYVNCIVERTGQRGRVHPPQFAPSPEACGAIAEVFGDDAHIVRVLAGKETPPPDAEARGLADKIARLPKARRLQVAEFVEFLLGRK